jgi:hypothetical protein
MMEAFDCDLYMDLMPLVKDGAASQTSRAALEAHLKECEMCRELYDTIPETAVEPDEGRVKKTMEKIRERYHHSLLVLGVLGVLLGVLLTMTRNMALTVAIFPMVGLGAYFLWRSRSLFIPLLVFSASWLLLSIRDGNTAEAVGWSFNYAYACLVGVLAGGVLAFIFDRIEMKSRLLRAAAVALVLIPVAYGMVVMDINIGGNPMFRESVEIRTQEYMTEEYSGQSYEITEIRSNTPLIYDYTVTVTLANGEVLELHFDGIWPEPIKDN